MEHVCPHWLSFILDNPVRRFFTDREGVVQRLSAQPGDRILELGCGNAFFTPFLLGCAPGVRVVMADIQPQMVTKALKKVHHDSRRYALPLVTHAGEISLKNASVNSIFLYFVFHEVQGKERAAAELYRVLAPGGHFCLWEPKMEVSVKLMAEFCRMFQAAGFRKVDEAETRWTRFAVFEKVAF